MIYIHDVKNKHRSLTAVSVNLLPYFSIFIFSSLYLDELTYLYYGIQCSAVIVIYIKYL
jgi:hypothetical protein